MPSQPKKIGLLFGSFNPPHFGHLALARLPLEEGKVDQVWVIPCFEHPFEKKLASFEDRSAMCHLLFQELGERVSILTVEKELGGKSFTARTIHHLKEKNSNVKFSMIVGEDIAKEAPTWQGYEEWKGEVGWIVYPRGPQSPIPDISATAIRKAFKEKRRLEKFLTKNVVEYIYEHGLYEDEPISYS
ncbi:MAG: nicotinate-nicotinamide nucleotide adenylyltransferase [Deltaproteobacteria bacterium]|nr:nicotinate-nicotinamide nucleotide adenylyltransferase [Deltaproteobacteria bacterium]